MIWTQVLRHIAPMLYLLSNCVSRQNLNFNPFKLSHHQFTPPLSFLRVDFWSTFFFVNSIFSMNVHSWFYFYGIVIFFIFVCRYLNQNCWVFANHGRNWTFQRFARVVEKERTQRNKQKIWHSLGFEPRSFGISRRCSTYSATVSVGITWILNLLGLHNINSLRRSLSFLWTFDRHFSLLTVFFIWLSSDDSRSKNLARTETSVWSGPQLVYSAQWPKRRKSSSSPKYWHTFLSTMLNMAFGRNTRHSLLCRRSPPKLLPGSQSKSRLNEQCSSRSIRQKHSTMWSINYCSIVFSKPTATIRRWLYDNMQNRRTKDNCRQRESKGRKVKTGVIIGGDLSPAHFNYYVADFPTPRPYVNLIKYADGITISTSRPEVVDPINGLNMYLSQVVNYTNSKTLSVPPAKSTDLRRRSLSDI